MKQELLNQYKIMVDFLGDTLGPDYEIVLFDLENGNNTVIAHSSKKQPNPSIGSKIPKEMLKHLVENTFSENDYCTNMPGKKNSISVNRNSCMLIKDSEGNLNGLLCIIFDDSRFIKLHDYLISVAHPLEFVKNHSFHTIHNMEMYENSQIIDNTSEQTPDTNLKNLIETSFRDAVMQADVPSDRLTQEERLTVIKYLKEYGFFRMKGAVPYAAEHLGCSTASIYRYLSSLKE